MLKRHDIAAVNHIDGRAILELKPGYLNLGIEPEIDLGIAGSEAARERQEEMFARIRQALKRRKVLELVEKAKRLAIGSGLTVTVTDVG